MNMMPSRLIHLAQIFAGYQKTGVLLIEWNQTHLSPFCAIDDIGIFICIPWLAHVLHIDLLLAINIFFYGIVCISALLGMFFLWQCLATYIGKAYLLISITALLFFICRAGDVYIFYAISALLLLPLSLYFFYTAEGAYRIQAYIILAIIVGILISFFHYLRSYSSLAALFFFVWSLWVTRFLTVFHKCILTAVLMISLCLPGLFFRHIYQRHIEYLENMQIKTQAVKHPLWHQIYMGLGFLAFKNPDPQFLQWGDPFSLAKAKSIDLNVINCSPEYESILRYEVFQLIKKYPLFVLNTICAKLGILLFYFIIFANIGFLAVFWRQKKWRLELGLWMSLCISSLFPLVTVPTSEYSLGFFAIATLYGILSYDALMQTLTLYTHLKMCYLHAKMLVMRMFRLTKLY